LNGDDLRRDPLEVRKATLASILAKAEIIRSVKEVRAWLPES
jgi:ATP-dependent DNA ligase